MSRGSPWAHSISRALGKNARPQICAFQTPCEGSHTGTVGTCAAVGFPWKPLRARFATTLDNTPSLCELGANRGLVSIRAQSHSQKSGGEVKSSKKGEEDKGIVRRLDYNAALTVSRLNLKVEPNGNVRAVLAVDGCDRAAITCNDEVTDSGIGEENQLCGSLVPVGVDPLRLDFESRDVDKVPDGRLRGFIAATCKALIRGADGGRILRDCGGSNKVYNRSRPGIKVVVGTGKSKFWVTIIWWGHKVKISRLKACELGLNDGRTVGVLCDSKQPAASRCYIAKE